MKEKKPKVIKNYPKIYPYFFVIGFFLIAMILCIKFREQLFYSILIYFNPVREAKVPNFIQEKYDVSEFIINNRKIYTISSLSPKKQVVFFLHGGAYAKEYSKEHWHFMDEMIQKLNITIVTPDYPVIPNGDYQDVFQTVIPAYEKVVEKYGASNITVIGDSAGGGIALALVENLNLYQKPLPQHTILLSPWLDVSMENPEIQNIDDKNLDLPIIKACGKKYAGDSTLNNYLISPLYGNLSGLQNIHLFIGTADMLNPDAHKLVNQAAAVGTKIILHEYKDMPHIWMNYYEGTATSKRHYRQTNGEVVENAKKAKIEIYKIIDSNF